MARPLRILQLTDTHLPCLPPRLAAAGYDAAARLRALVATLVTTGRKADAVLVTGDIADTGSAEAYHLLAELLRPLDAPIHCLPGNHDAPTLMQQILPPLGLHYAPRFTLGAWQILCLDSSQTGRTEGMLGAAQLAALASALQAQPDMPTLIALHHPPLAVGTPWMDVYALQDGTAFLELLAQHAQVRGVVFGHIHHAYSGAYAQIPLWGTPSTCVQFVPGSTQFTIDPPVGPAARWLYLASDGTLRTELTFHFAPQDS